MTAVLARPKRRIFTGSPDQVRHARDFVGRVLDGCPVAEDATLLTSELVTNAIVHTASGAGGTLTVTVWRSGAVVRVEVRDGGSAKVPAPRPRGRAEESGLGLSLVELLAKRWGHGGGARGRVVWFELGWGE